MNERLMFFVLDRDRAKQLFAARGPEALEAFISELLRDETVNVLATGPEALELHNELTGGEGDEGTYPLNHAVLGGREMNGGETRQVLLKRPDMAGHIATALASGSFGPEVNDVALKLQALYEAAAAANSAVLLVIE
jgi:hypothetical protein